MSSGAGESGRGFAVVADEVRTLAARTQAATDDIQKIITKVLDITHNVSGKMAVSQERSRASSAAALEVQSSFRHITDHINQINGKVAGIQQHISASHRDGNAIEQSIGAATAITEQCQVHSQNISKLNQSLRSLALELHGELAHFKV